MASRLEKVHQDIINACAQFGRTSKDIQLLAVSKSHSITSIREAARAGQFAFGENYVQEARLKIEALQDLPLEWHYIGQIQSNKTRAIAEHFDWVHTVSSIRIAKRLADQRPDNLPPLNVCIEVNIDQAENKGGITVNNLFLLSEAILSLPRLRLRGLMVIPEPRENIGEQRLLFKRCQILQSELSDQLGIKLDTLSMGMSQDFVAAIAEGSTLIRIGSAIFGKRASNHPIP